MESKSAENIPDFAKEAIITFNEIMSKKKDIMEDINRANKGELFVLQFLSMLNTAVLPSELSTALQISSARISAVLGSLEKKGQIEREIDRSNRRNILVTITAAGHERVKTEVNEIEQILAHAFIEMGETDAMEYLRLFEKFFGIMQKHINETCNTSG